MHKAVNKMVQNKLLSCRELIYFSYERKGKYAYPKKNSDTFINFNETFLKRKKRLIRDVYGFSKNSFEDICCRGAEAFDVERLK